MVGFSAVLLLLSADGAGGQTADDHGDNIGVATPLPLGSSVEGRLDSGEDLDVFRLDLTAESSDADVWIYATGGLDNVGDLLTSDGSVIVSNDDSFITGRYRSFHIRWVLSPGVYYIRVSSYSGGTGERPTGDYGLHAEAVTHYPGGGSIATATPLEFDSPTPVMIESAGDADYFKLELAEPMNLYIYAGTIAYKDASDEWLPWSDLAEQVLDSTGARITVSVDSNDLGFSIEHLFGPGIYYVRVTTAADAPSHPVPYTIHMYEDADYPYFIEDRETDTRALYPSQAVDPLYGCQWYLSNHEGEDIDVEAVWADGLMGRGVNIAVVDDGMDHGHEDLRDNVDRARSHDYTGASDIHHPYEHHGTRVTGIIAAQDNGVGVRGVAPRATVYGYNYLANTTNENVADAMARNRDVTAVSNNSWGHIDGPRLSTAARIWELAVDAGTREGHGGKGVFYAIAGGNGFYSGDESNFDEYNSYHGVTSVCAVGDDDTRSGYSEAGANLWVCGPSSGGERRIVTTENADRYNPSFGGTSAATPVVAGVAALMREANPDLTWRDLKLVLAASARKNDPANPGWELGAARYGPESDSDRYHFNHEYGFGMVDARAAVDLAKDWEGLPTLESHTTESGELNLPVPDAPAGGGSSMVESSLIVNTSVGFVEFVEINVSFQHDSIRDLEIELVSPSGTVSRLAGHLDTYSEFPYYGFVPLRSPFRFGSARHLGEDPNGVWKLQATDHIANVEGNLVSWGVTFYGHESIPGTPTVDWVAGESGSLTVGWAAPRQTGGSPVTGYDLRHRLASSDGAADTEWTVVDDVWTAETGGSLDYTIAGLDVDAQHEVQVRAVNRAGAGRWSSGFTAAAAPSPCATAGAIVDPSGNPGLVSDCRTLMEVRQTLDQGGTLDWDAGTPISAWDGVVVEGTPMRVVGLSLQDKGLTGQIPAQLGNLPRLKNLDLSQNELTGGIPSWLARLGDLAKLDLSHNGLTGEIPPALGNLAVLPELDLSQNRLSGEIPAELRGLSRLARLSLDGNELGGEIPAWLPNLPSLSSLFLAENSFTGCIPEGLRGIAPYDLDKVGLLFCGRGVLAVLYNATGGANWNTSTNWLSGKPIRQWSGVTVDYHGRVTHLDLDSNNLAGEIPSELGDLPRLQTLYLSYNQLTGSIPTRLGNLSKLRSLDLRGNQLTDSIPAETGNLSGLRFLNLSSNQLTGGLPAELGNLSKLDSLSAGGNKLTGRMPATLGDLSRLESLYLSSNQLTGGIPTALGDLSRLESLRLSSNQLTGGIPKSLANLSRLESLNLGSNQLMGGVPPELANLSRLESLRLHSNQLTGIIPPSLGNLSKLEYLSLYSNQLTGAIPKAFGSLAKLESLYLNSNQLTGGIPTELGSLSRLEVLSLYSNHLTGEIPLVLASLAKLETLSLSSNQLTGEIPTGLGSLVKLETLYLNSNQLTGEIPTELGNLAKLQNLRLGSNELTGQIPSELGDLSELQSLDLRSNSLTGRIPAELGNLAELATLYLDGNGLTGCIPAELRSVPTNDLDRLRLPFCSASAPGAPAIGAITFGLGSLAVSWDPPSRDGGSAIIAYDLRHRETAANEEVRSRWTVVEDAWTVGGGALQFSIAGLMKGAVYDIQVRAVNAIGDGPWSATATAGTPTTPTIGAVTPGPALLTISWDRPSSDGGSVIIAYDLRHIETDADEALGSTWTVVENAWTAGGGALRHTLAGLTGDTDYAIQVRAVNAVGGGPWSATAHRNSGGGEHLCQRRRGCRRDERGVDFGLRGAPGRS